MGNGVHRSGAFAPAVALAVALAVGGCARVDTASDARAGPSQGLTPSVPSSVGSPAKAPALTVGSSAWVAVSVATVWRSPAAPRSVDAPALRNPAGIVTWLDAMTLAERRGLSGRADTQALLDDRVVVLALPPDRPAWARVAVPSQPTPLDPRGYPGWVPRRQLTALPPVPSAQRATVVRRTAWLLTDRADPARLFRVSLGTDLGVVGETAGFVRVRTPMGAVRRLDRGAVVVHDVGQPPLAPTRTSVVATARRFIGLPYLWAGASGFGLDCSGLTWLDYRIHGIRIPRDAMPQSRAGTHVARPGRGDLMFYAASGVVHHVTMYVGDGRMLHSPRTGRSVEVIRTSTAPFPAQYAGSRRFVP